MTLMTVYFLCAVFIVDLSILEKVEAKGQGLQVRLTAGILEYANPEYMGPQVYLRVTRKSRKSPPILNALFPIIKELPLETNITWQCFQKINNAWKPSLIKGNGLLCDILQSKNKLQRMLFEYSDMPSKCPVKKGNYTVKDFSVITNGLPPVIPGSEWKAHCTWGTQRGNIVSYSMEVKLDRKGDQHSVSDAAAAEAAAYAVNKN